MVSFKVGLAIFVIAIAAGFTSAPVLALDPSPDQEVIPSPPDEAPEAPASEIDPSLPVADAVYRVEHSGDGEVQSELVRWHRGWGHRGWGWGGGWGWRRGWGYPGWGWGRRWATIPVYRPYYGAYFGYPALGLGYPAYAGGGPYGGFGYGNQFTYGNGNPYGGGYGMGYPDRFGYPAYAYYAPPVGVGVGFW